MTEVNPHFLDERLKRVEAKLDAWQNAIESSYPNSSASINLRTLMDLWREIDGREPSP